MLVLIRVVVPDHVDREHHVALPREIHRERWHGIFGQVLHATIRPMSMRDQHRGHLRAAGFNGL